MRFGVLGPTEVWDGERLVEPGPARRRLVLAALLVDVGRVVPLETLLDRVWDGRPSESATGTLQTYISRLRVTLGSAVDSTPATVTTSPRGYALDVPDDDVDARRFEALLARAGGRRDDGDPAGARALVGEALGLWRGAAYADFATGFTAVEAARLHDLRLSAHELAADLDLALGHHAEAAHALRPLVAAEPLREPLRAALMLALYRSGRSPEALQVYAEGREVLADQLGADPDAATQALHARILRQDPALDLAPPPVVVAAPEPADPVSDVLTPAAAPERLVGRDAELGRLLGAVEQAATGTTGFVAVVGEAGIGKSRLVEELAGRARTAGQVVAWGRCWQHEGAPTLWPWVQVLRELGHRLPDDVVLAATGGRAAPVAALVPELAHGATVAADAHGTTLDEAEVRVFDAVVTFLQAVSADRPLVLVVDDLQWADPASRRLTEYVATHLRGSRVTVVVTVRSPALDDDHPDLEVLAALARLTRVQRLDLHPITADDVRALLRDRVGDDVDEPTAAALHARTGGNPFYIGEIVRLVLTTGVETALAEGVPDSVRGVIRRRVQRLPEADQAVLRAAAVLGRTFDIDLVAAVTGIDEDEVDEAVDRATVLGLLRSEPSTADLHRFTHALLQETLFDETGPSRRRRLHRRTAEVLVERREGTRSGPAFARWIAYHLEGAGGDDGLREATRWLLLGTDEALARQNWTEAAELLHHASDVVDRVAEGADALRVTVDVRLRSLHTAFQGAHASHSRWGELVVDDLVGTPLELVVRWHARWADLHGRNQLDAGDEAADVMVALGEQHDDPLLRAVGLHALANSSIQRGTLPEAEDAADRVGALVEHVDIPPMVFLPDPRVGGPLTTAFVVGLRGDDTRADALLAAAAATADRVADPVGVSYVAGNRLYLTVWREDAPAARAAAAAVEKALTEHGLVMMRPYMDVPIAWALATTDLARGVEASERAVAALAPTMLFRPHLLATHADLLRRAGRWDDALREVDTGLAEAVTSGAHGADALLHRVRAQVLAASGAPRADVTAAVEQGLAIAREQGAGLFERQLRVLASHH